MPKLARSLTMRVIVFELTRHYDQNTSTSQTDRQKTCHGNTALCVASRGLHTRDVKSLDRPRPRDTVASATCRPASWSRLLQCIYFMFCRNCYTVKSVIMKTKDGNVVNEARSGQGREKNGKPCPATPVLPHDIIVTVSDIKSRIYC